MTKGHSIHQLAVARWSRSCWRMIWSRKYQRRRLRRHDRRTRAWLIPNTPRPGVNPSGDDISPPTAGGKPAGGDAGSSSASPPEPAPSSDGTDKIAHLDQHRAA